MSRPLKKIHYGNRTLGRVLCGRIIKCDDCMTRDEKRVTCDQCHKALG